jgi:hypothetical protein
MTNPATPKQISFLTTLMAERILEPNQREALSDLPSLNSREASIAISVLLSAPKAPKATPVFKDKNALTEALESIPHSHYAVSAIEANLILQDKVIDNDLLFLATREYRGTEYVRQLHGSVGEFTESKLSYQDSLAIIKHIAKNPEKHARLFGESWGVCGKCGAKLTDETSRKVGFGPKCRGAFGL